MSYYSCSSYSYIYCYNWYYSQYWINGWNYGPYDDRIYYRNPFYGWGNWPYCYTSWRSAITIVAADGFNNIIQAFAVKLLI